jgi:hypothetical protein
MMTTIEYGTHAVAKIIWRSQIELGRRMPPPGITQWAATARFTEDDEHDLFSVVLSHSEGQAEQEVNLHFFAPELVVPRLGKGARLYITDGPKIIADTEILAVTDDARDAL